MSDTVSEDMLTDLQHHFTHHHRTPREDAAVVIPAREPLGIQHGPPLNLQLPDIDNLPHRLAANGSSTDSEGTGAYAAITGTGRVILGYFTCPTSNVQLAALQAVRFGLRELDADRVEVFVANLTVADSLRDIAGGKPARHADTLADRNAIRDITRTAHRIDIQVRHINGKPATDLLPAHPLLQAASRLSQVACRLAVAGIPFDATTRQWLHNTATLTGHRRHNLLHHCDQYITHRTGRPNDH